MHCAVCVVCVACRRRLRAGLWKADLGTLGFFSTIRFYREEPNRDRFNKIQVGSVLKRFDRIVEVIISNM